VTVDINNQSLKKIEKEILSSSRVKQNKILQLLKNDKRKGSQNIYKKVKNEIFKNEKEKNRYKNLFSLERKLLSESFSYIAGVDESGRGCLAGPLVAAAVILPENAKIDGLKDSKQLSAGQRELLFLTILETALSYRVEVFSNEVIDKDGLHKTNLRALKVALENLSIKPDFALIDGYALNNLPMSSLRVIKGDFVSGSIAAASIVAKVHRDRIMKTLHKKFPEYGFISHKGYGSKKHLEALSIHGTTSIHRKSFTIVKEIHETKP